MRRRLESAAPSGGVMVSESTAHLVGDGAPVAEAERVQSWDQPNQWSPTACWLRGATSGAWTCDGSTGRSSMGGLGRRRDAGAVDHGQGHGSSGWSVRRASARAAWCESSSSTAERAGDRSVHRQRVSRTPARLPFYAVTRLLRRNIFAVRGSCRRDAVEHSGSHALADADPRRPRPLLDDLLGIHDGERLPCP